MLLSSAGLRSPQQPLPIDRLPTSTFAEKLEQAMSEDSLTPPSPRREFDREDIRYWFTEAEVTAAMQLVLPETEARAISQELFADPDDIWAPYGDTLSLLSLLSTDAAARLQQFLGESDEEARARVLDLQSRLDDFREGSAGQE